MNKKWKIILPIAIVVLLVAAFWFGGNAPGLQGWGVGDKDESSQTEIVTPDNQVDEQNKEDSKEVANKEDANKEDSNKDTDKNVDKDTNKQDNKKEDNKNNKEFTGKEGKGDVEYSESHGMVIDKETGKDKYLTDPVPEGKPVPIDPQNVTISDVEHTCTISISCATINDNKKWLTKGKEDLVPEDGWILKPTEVTFYEGESVFNVLLRTCKQNKIHMEYENTPMYNSAYIEGINNLYEFDCGELSGWMYSVNDWFPNYGCSRYQLKQGDKVEWKYTCDLGKDVGDTYLAGQK